ncbi:MAG: hypothetical protein Q7S27_00665 [Nanoarchaeota archaeon]|nr:hypothetical protein [Nanoarchaeota archaeon]
MDYINLQWRGKIDKIIYSECTHSDNLICNLISPQGEMIVTRFHLAMDNGGGYCGEFIGEIPKEYMGKPITLTLSLETIGGVKVHKRVLSSEGLEPLVSEVKWVA